MQFRRLTGDAGLTSGRELEQRSRVGSHRSNSEHPKPLLHPASARSRSQRCRHAGGTVSCQEAQEGERPPTSIPSTTSRARLAPWSSGRVWCRLRLAASCTAAAGRVSAPGRAEPVRVTGLTIVAPIASWAPCHRGKPLATTSMRRASLTSTSMFMSPTRTFRATCAPASRQTRATACSSGRAREASNTDVAQAERWSPSWSKRPWKEHVRGAQGKGSQRRRSSNTRRCADGTTTAGDVGNAVKARAACESSSARDAGELRAICGHVDVFLFMGDQEDAE